MDDKTGALEKLKAIMAKAEQVDMSSVKIGDIIYVPLDEEDGLILKDGYKDRNKYIVIIGFTPEGVAIGALLINSEIDSSKRSEELLDCQYPLMVRAEPNTDGEVIAEIPKNGKCICLGCYSGEWYVVTYEHNGIISTGFSNKNYLRRDYRI